MRKRVFASWLICWLTVFARADLPKTDDKAFPNRIQPTVVVFSPAWASQVPPKGRVNAPEFFTMLFAGGKLALGLISEGPDRDQAFDTVTLDVRISTGATAPKVLTGLKPVVVRKLKAQGADFAILALRGSGISDAEQMKMEEATSLQTLAVFTLDWVAPTDPKVTDVEIAVTASGTKSPVTIEPAHLKVRSMQDWLKAPPPAEEEVGRQMNRYRGYLPPGQLLSEFVTLAKAQRLKVPAVQAYYAFQLKLNADVRNAAIAAFPSLEPEVQTGMLWMLRLAGYDLPTLFPSLTQDALSDFAAIDPMGDPRKLFHFENPVEPQAVSQLGLIMDQCWAGWMATGDTSYLRPLVGLLENRADFPALRAWQESQGGAKGLSAKIARGLAYQIAGWSLGSFQRSDPLVADWLRAWQDDPTFSSTIRQEIATLATNPAFRRR